MQCVVSDDATGMAQSHAVAVKLNTRQQTTSSCQRTVV